MASLRWLLGGFLAACSGMVVVGVEHGVAVIPEGLDDKFDHAGVLVSNDDVPPAEGGRGPRSHCQPWDPGDIRGWQAGKALRLPFQDRFTPDAGVPRARKTPPRPKSRRGRSFQRAGDRTRTGDVQLGKLAFYH
jgi:hypothetical protein